MIDVFGALLATVIGFGFSFLYYSPFFAGSEWAKSIGMDDPLPEHLSTNKKRMKKVYAITFLVNLISFFGISYILYLMQPANYDEVFVFSIILWFIISGVGLIQSLFQNKNIYSHVLSTIDDAARIIMGTAILYIML